MNIVFTGNKGLIGAFLEKKLLEEGHNIISKWDLRNGKNILDINKNGFSQSSDLLIHAAAHCKINESIANPQKTYENNVKGTYEVMEFARLNNIPKVLFFSSSRILSPEENPYTASKKYGENLVRAYYDSYGIEYLIVRPSTVYGPFWDETKRLMHIFITNALQGKDLEIYGDPKTKTLDFTHVDDFVDATIIALNGEWNRKYNISGGEEFNVYDLAREIIEKTSSNSKIIIKDAEISQPQKVSCDISKIKKKGYLPKVPLSKGLDECIAFYKEFF
jgi:UDP-glucose 4-epimerase